jgi:Ca-activated chloride channel family protein
MLFKTCARLSPALAAIAVLFACTPQPDPYFVDREQAIEENRFLKKMHSPEPVLEEEPPPEDQWNTDEEAYGTGQRHKGEEGKMGKPTSRMKSGLYAMKGPKDAIPQMARSYAAAAAVDEPGCTDCGPGGDKYFRADDNPWMSTVSDPLSTFSIDVDTASYSNVRRFLQDGTLPPPSAVRVEELVNYFDYDYPQPTDDRPFSVSAEVAPCPWADGHQLVQIGLQGKALPQGMNKPRNLVFLVDVSGSMSEEDKLPLLKHGLMRLVDDMNARDRISIVVYAGASGLVLPPTAGDQKKTIRDALGRLQAGGSTNGGAGIALAYAQARKHFVQDGVNRIILASDGDFNVGLTSHEELVQRIEHERKGGVFLTVLGFGRGNFNDHTMEQLADKGNGNYAYIDGEREAEKVLVHEVRGTLVTIAKDVKLQVEFNPTTVAAYRLVGYENRRLANKDFKDDTKDAGELGAGHNVTGLYEVIPAGKDVPFSQQDPLKYQRPSTVIPKNASRDLFTVKLRYKRPDGDTSKEFEVAVDKAKASVADTSPSFRLAAAVAGFALKLRDPQAESGLSFAEVRKLAEGAKLADPHGYRKEFLGLVDAAERLVAPRAGNLALVDDELN